MVARFVVFSLLCAAACSEPVATAGTDAASAPADVAVKADLAVAETTADTAIADSTVDVATIADAKADAGADTASDGVADATAQPDGAADTAIDSAPDVGPEAGPDLPLDALLDPPDLGTDVTAATAPSPGCADGTREGFLDLKKYPLAAGCAGAWSVKGIHAGVPACGRKAGNDGANANGTGCNVEDLCAEGWHVCYGAKDLKERNPLGCGGIMDGGAKSPAFYLARSSSTGAFNCSQDSTKFGGPGTSNDLFGCGDLGCGIAFATYPSCDPLDRASHDLCKGLRNDMACGDWCAHLGKFPGQKNTWDCGKDTVNEANNVIKADPATQGGVLCCGDAVGP